MSKIVFFFSNTKNIKNNQFVNSLIDKNNLDVVKINIDKRNLNINTPALKINNKLINNKDCLVFLAKYEQQNKNNKVINSPQPPNDVSEPHTFDTLEMNNFSDSYSFIGDKNPLISKYEYLNKTNNSPPPPTNLNTINSSNLSISDEKKKLNTKSYEDFIHSRNNDPYLKR